MKKRMLCLLVSLCLVLFQTAPAFAANSNAVSEASNGVVQVYAETVRSDGTVAMGVGTAFGVGTVGEPTNIFVTNRHVVTAENADGSLTQSQTVYLMLGANALSVTLRAVEIDGELVMSEEYLPPLYTANTSQMVACEVLYISDEYDLAVLKTREPVEDRVALELAGKAEQASTGQQVYAVGYPAVSDETATATGWVFSGNYLEDMPIYTYTYTYNSQVSDVTVTTGAISRFTTMTGEGDVRVIQHDATVHGGNSGGPLINENGVVVGINTYSGSEASLNYAIYVDYAREVLDELEIPYNNAQSNPFLIPAIAGGVVVLAVIVMIVVLVVRRGRGKRAPEPIQAADPVPVPETPVPQPTQPVASPAVQPTAQADNGLRLQGVSGSFAGRRFPLSGTLRIGRDPQLNQLVYPPQVKGISRTHCELSVVNGQVYLKDLGSSYGTFLAGGQRLAASQAILLKPGDSFSLASEQETFVVIQKGGV